MNCITVPASKEYNVCIGSGLLDQIGNRAAKVIDAKKVAIISDSNVWPIYGEKVREIRIGRQNPQFYEVLEGLEPGEKVITSGYDNFGDNEVLIF